MNPELSETGKTPNQHDSFIYDVILLGLSIRFLLYVKALRFVRKHVLFVEGDRRMKTIIDGFLSQIDHSRSQTKMRATSG